MEGKKIAIKSRLMAKGLLKLAQCPPVPLRRGRRVSWFLFGRRISDCAGLTFVSLAAPWR